MAVVVGAPYVDTQVIAALFNLVAVVRDVRRKIGGVAVLANEHLILFRTEIGGAVPQCAVLFICEAALGQQIERFLQLAIVVQRALQKPLVIFDAVFFQVILHLLNVAGQYIFHQLAAAGFFIALHQLVAERICV